MSGELNRRDFLKTAIVGGALCAGCAGPRGFMTQPTASKSGRAACLVSPGCRGTKVRVGKVYVAKPGGLWPTPKLSLQDEVRAYESDFARMKNDFADVEFVGNQLVTNVDEARKAAAAMKDVDGILVIHLSMGVQPMLHEILAVNRPTVLFAAPYSGHEWTGFGAMTREKPLLDCMLTADRDQLAAAVRPFRAMHHMREAKILNITAKPWAADLTKSYKERFGTEVVVISRERALAAYESVPEALALAEADRWWTGAMAVVEPDRDEVVRSCRLALAFEKLLDEEKATVITADCYRTMYHQLPAFPCLGNVRLNNMGLGGICESDPRCAMTHILMQGLVGRPGFISDPTVDASQDSIILAHCLGTMKMDGPEGPTAPYKLRSIMERQEGCVPQVFMRPGERVTQAILVGTDRLQFFTGTITAAPDLERGCRTKIIVRVDGSIDGLWRNWTSGLHRQTCYGDLRDDLRRFCKFQGITLIDEAA